MEETKPKRVRSAGGREMNGHGGARPGAGRKSNASKGLPTSSSDTVGAYLTADQIEYLKLWNPGGNMSQAVSDLIDRAMKFWPKGV